MIMLERFGQIRGIIHLSDTIYLSAAYDNAITKFILLGFASCNIKLPKFLLLAMVPHYSRLVADLIEQF